MLGSTWMRVWALGCLFWASVICGAGFGQTDFGSVLDALEAPLAADRFGAERLLIAELGADDGPGLVQALVARGGLGQEATWRLGRAIGSRPGNLGLALDLLTGKLAPQAEVDLEVELLNTGVAPEDGWGLGRRLGRLALEQEISGWRVGLDARPMAGAALQLALEKERERNPWKRLHVVDGGVARVVSQLAREGELPVALTLSQGLADQLSSKLFGSEAEPSGLVFKGPWDQVLLEFARAHDLAWEAVLFEGDADDEIAWLRLVSLDEAGVESGAAQLTRALGDVARSRAGQSSGALSGAELELAARFLGCVEWDAALGWLAVLLERDGHHMARTALLEAATRGHVHSSLATRKGVEGLLAWASKLAPVVKPGSGYLGRLGTAFGRFPRIGADGSDLAGVLSGGWELDGSAAKLTVCVQRLRGLSGMQVGDPAARRLARGVLAEQRSQATLSALEVLGLGTAVAGENLLVGNPSGLIGLVPDRVAPDSLARLLAKAEVSLPLGNVGQLRPAALRLHLMTRVLSGDFPGAAQLLAGDGANGLDLGAPGSWGRLLEAGAHGRRFDAVSGGLRELMRSGELLATRAVIGIAFDLAKAKSIEGQPTGLARLELLVGAMDATRQAALLADLQSRGQDSIVAGDLGALAILAAAPMAQSLAARQHLTAHFARDLEQADFQVAAASLAAIERCLATFWARSADADADNLVLEVASIAAGATNHPIAQKILFGTWPPLPE